MAGIRIAKQNKKLLDLRTRLGLTQSEMAKKFRVTLRTYQRYESRPKLEGPVQIVAELLEKGVI